MKRVTILLLILGFCNAIKAQKEKSLEDRLQGKTKLQDVMKVVEKYYAEEKKEEEKEKRKEKRKENQKQSSNTSPNEKDCPTCNEDESGEGYIHWKRWEYFNRSRVADDGTLQNIFARNNNEYRSKGFNAYRENTGPNGTLTPAFNPNWTQFGPDNIINATQATGIGRVNNMAFHPTVANTMFAATSSGGVFKTTNGGTTWFPISDDISSLGAADVVVNYNNPNTLYILTGDGESNNGWNWFVQAYGYLRYSTGVLKSTDGGQTWQQTGLVFNATDFKVGFKLTMHPTNPLVLLAATTDGIYRTLDGGNTWTLVATSGTGKGFYDVKFKLNNGNVAFATERGYSSILQCSSDAGGTWSTTATSGLPDFSYRYTIGLPTNAPDSVYVLCGKSVTASTYKGLYKGKYNSVNNTISFSLVHNTPNVISAQPDGVSLANGQDAAEYNMCLAVANGNVVTGATWVWKSSNWGNNFTGAGANLHADVHSLQYNPLNNKLYAGCDGGVYESSDNGATFASICYGLTATQIYHMADFEPDPQKLLIGTQDNGTNYRPSATTVFTNIGGCDGFAQAFHPAVFDTMLFICNTTVYRSYNNGTTNNSDVNPPGHGSWYSLVGFKSQTPRIHYVGAENGFYRQEYFNGPWTLYSGKRGNSALRICPNTNRIYMAGAAIIASQGAGATFYRTDDDCASFVNLINKPGMPVLSGTQRYITSVYTVPDNTSNVWITIGGYQAGEKVYHSVDAGENWQNETDNLPNVPVNTVAVDVDGNVYIGNDFGVFARRPGDTEWFPFYNGLPNVPVTDIAINDNVLKIRVSTFGRGIWEADLVSGTCPYTLNITGNYSGQYNFSAVSNITTTAVAVNSSGTKLTMNANNNIVLNDGFRGNAGSYVKIQIAPCGPVNIDRSYFDTAYSKQLTTQQQEISKLATQQSLLQDSISQAAKDKANKLPYTPAVSNAKLADEIEADKKRQQEKEAAKKKSEMKKEE